MNKGKNINFESVKSVHSIKKLMKPVSGFNSSFSNIKTRRKFKSNIQRAITLSNGRKCKVSTKLLKNLVAKKIVNITTMKVNNL